MTYVYHTSILHFEENDNEQDLDLSFSSASGVSHIQSVYPNYQKGTTKREKYLREWDAVERRRLQGRWYNKGLSGFSKDCVIPLHSSTLKRVLVVKWKKDSMPFFICLVKVYRRLTQSLRLLFHAAVNNRAAQKSEKRSNSIPSWYYLPQVKSVILFSFVSCYKKEREGTSTLQWK